MDCFAFPCMDCPLAACCRNTGIGNNRNCFSARPRRAVLLKRKKNADYLHIENCAGQRKQHVCDACGDCVRQSRPHHARASKSTRMLPLRCAASATTPAKYLANDGVNAAVIMVVLMAGDVAEYVAQCTPVFLFKT